MLSIDVMSGIFVLQYVVVKDPALFKENQGGHTPESRGTHPKNPLFFKENYSVACIFGLNMRQWCHSSGIDSVVTVGYKRGVVS